MEKLAKKSFSAVKLFLNRNGQDLSSMSVDDLLKIIEQHAIKTLKKQKRKLPETFNFKLISKNHLNYNSLIRTASLTVIIGRVLMVSLQLNF